MKRTVLVIDDDKMILDMIQGILEDKFEVSAVNDGQKAFRVLERIHPDVILLDLKMPGMDGYDVISRLKVNQEYKGIPVIFLTAVTDEYSETKCFEAGASCRCSCRGREAGGNRRGSSEGGRSVWYRHPEHEGYLRRGGSGQNRSCL